MEENKILLPKTFRQKDIDYLTQGKGNPEWEKHIAKPKISYSEMSKMWENQYVKNPLKEYILQHFLGQESSIPDAYGIFGTCIEDFICHGKEECNLEDSEKETLKQITPYGNYQVPFLIDFGNFVFIGKKDDQTTDAKIIRDYKTASESSVTQYDVGYPKYKQLHIYALERLINHNQIPEKLEVVAIERLGNPFKSEPLKVGKKVWQFDFVPTETELLELKELIINTANKISDYYKVFLRLNV